MRRQVQVRLKRLPKREAKYRSVYRCGGFAKQLLRNMHDEVLPTGPTQRHPVYNSDKEVRGVSYGSVLHAMTSGMDQETHSLDFDSVDLIW